MEKFENQCQSCGMPLQEGKVSGTEKDGSKSKTYCELCYMDGKFIDPDITVEQMKEIADKGMKEKGIIWPMRLMAKWQIPTLKRWKK